MRKAMLVTGIACLGCSEPSPSRGVVVQDSIGVAIVINNDQKLAATHEWHLGTTPSVSVSSGEEGATLFQVLALTRSESGLIVVANGGTNEVLLFDGRGTFAGKRGREGDGPGEFRSLSSVLALGGDSLGVYDSRHKRLSVFDPDGELAREFTLDSPGDSDYERLFLLADGGFAVFAQGGLRGGQSGSFRSVAESFSIDRTGVRTGSFGGFPGAEVFISRMAGLVLFGANTFGAVADEDLVVGTAKEPELRFYGRGGRLKRILRWPDHERRVTEERIEEYMAAAEASMPDAARPQARAMLAEIPRSDQQPAFEDVLSSPSGEIWIGEYRGPEMALPGARSPSRGWLIFDREGVLTASVKTPMGFQPLYVGVSEVIGVSMDELGVESIEAYEVLRDPGEGNGL
jgi:hypothetical protein